MLYAITDKFGKPFGVHECAPKDILTHIRSLPRQGAPYLTQPAMPFFKRVRAARGWHSACGFVAGAAVTEGIAALLHWFL